MPRKNGRVSTPRCLSSLREPLGIHVRCLVGQHDAVHPVDVARPGLFGRQLQPREPAETPRVRLAHPALSRDDVVDAAHLGQPQRGLEVGEAEVESGLFMDEPALRLESTGSAASAPASAIAASSVTSMPPSPVVISLFA